MTMEDKIAQQTIEALNEQLKETLEHNAILRRDNGELTNELTLAKATIASMMVDRYSDPIYN